VKEIEIVTSNGKVFHLGNVPDDAKLTFGALNPSSKGMGGPAALSLTLRIYKGTRDNGHQIAVFRNVESFRDLSLTIKEIETKPKQTWIDGGQD
jgi:hypothetical protein